MSLVDMPCFDHEEEDEERPKLPSHCHASSCLKSPSSLSHDEEQEAPHDSKHVIVLEIRNRATKARTKLKDYLFGGSLDIGKEDEGDDDDVQSEVFYSVKSCFSRSSSGNELDYFSHCRGWSIWGEFTHCEGWPFGLSRKALMLPPLPSSPSESWTWRKRNLGTKGCTSA